MRCGDERVDDGGVDGDVLFLGDVGEAGEGGGGVEGGEAEFGAAGGEGFDDSAATRLVSECDSGSE